jgi:Holliday junction DNA helicase RuvA
MIIGINGTLLRKRNTDRFCELAVYTPAGITYLVVAPVSYEIDENSEIKLFTTLVVREDSQTLYGFLTLEEKDLFDKLITVSGVGPKTAISILSYYGFSQTVSLIVDGNEKSLSKVSGLGTKSAKKIIIELQARLEGIALNGSLNNGFSSSQKMKSQQLEELEDALHSLGFTGMELKRHLENARLLIKADPLITVEKLVTDVLKK